MFKTDRVGQWDNGPYCTVKAVLSGHPIKDEKLAFKTDYRLMQNFRPSLSYHLSFVLSIIERAS